MRYAFFTNTPAHVHLYKYAAKNLVERGHDVLVLGRDYGVTKPLLEYYDLNFEIYGSCDTTKYSLFSELPRHYANIIRKIHDFDPDLIFGIGAYAAHAGGVSRTPVVTITDSEPTGLDQRLTLPFVDTVLTPASFKKELGRKHYRFNGFKESAYLHPDVYEPMPEIYDELAIDEDQPYIIVRLNAWGSSHDVSESGFSAAQRSELISTLSQYATVFVSDEGGEVDDSSLPARTFDVHPALFHEALRNAELMVADTQTAVTEAALLGTPAIRSNSWVGPDDMGNFLELEEVGLVENVREFDTVLERSQELLTEDVKAKWTSRSEDYMSNLINLTDLITTIATGQLETPIRNSLSEMSEVYG